MGRKEELSIMQRNGMPAVEKHGQNRAHVAGIARQVIPLRKACRLISTARRDSLSAIGALPLRLSHHASTHSTFPRRSNSTMHRHSMPGSPHRHHPTCVAAAVERTSLAVVVAGSCAGGAKTRQRRESAIGKSAASGEDSLAALRRSLLVSTVLTLRRAVVALFERSKSISRTRSRNGERSRKGVKGVSERIPLSASTSSHADTHALLRRSTVSTSVTALSAGRTALRTRVVVVLFCRSLLRAGNEREGRAAVGR